MSNSPLCPPSKINSIFYSHSLQPPNSATAIHRFAFNSPAIPENLTEQDSSKSFCDKTGLGEDSTEDTNKKLGIQ